MTAIIQRKPIYTKLSSVKGISDSRQNEQKREHVFKNIITHGSVSHHWSQQHRQNYDQCHAPETGNFEDLLGSVTQFAAMHSRVDRHSYQYSKGKAEQMHQRRSSEADQHEGHEQHEDNDHPKACGIGVLQVGAVREDHSQKHPEVAAQHPTEAQEPSFEADDSEALGSHSPQQPPENGRLPAVLEFVHHEYGEDHIADQVQVVAVHENARDDLIEVFLIAFDQLDVQEPLVHLTRPFGEVVVFLRGVHDMVGDEQSDVQNYQKARHRRHFEMREETVLYHIEVTCVCAKLSLMEEGDLDRLHCQSDLIMSVQVRVSNYIQPSQQANMSLFGAINIGTVLFQRICFATDMTYELRTFRRLEADQLQPVNGDIVDLYVYKAQECKVGVKFRNCQTKKYGFKIESVEVKVYHSDSKSDSTHLQMEQKWHKERLDFTYKLHLPHFFTQQYKGDPTSDKHQNDFKTVEGHLQDLTQELDFKILSCFEKKLSKLSENELCKKHCFEQICQWTRNKKPILQIFQVQKKKSKFMGYEQGLISVFPIYNKLIKAEDIEGKLFFETYCCQSSKIEKVHLWIEQGAVQEAINISANEGKTWALGNDDLQAQKKQEYKFKWNCSYPQLLEDIFCQYVDPAKK